jgi:hypothetical protein
MLERPEKGKRRGATGQKASGNMGTIREMKTAWSKKGEVGKTHHSERRRGKPPGRLYTEQGPNRGDWKLYDERGRETTAGTRE